MSEFIEKEESFKLGLLEGVPEPPSGKCFLLYQTGGGLNNSMIVNHGEKYSSTAVKRAHYNRKATICLNERSFRQTYQVAMKEQNFQFEVVVETNYYLQDVREYFFNGKMEEDDMQRMIREVIREQDGKWNVQESLNLRNELENNIEHKLRRFIGVRIKTPTINVRPDDVAVQILNSNRDTTVQINRTKNEADKKIVINQQDGRIADSEYILKGKKIANFANMVQIFGEFAPIMEEYLKGSINGIQVQEYIAKAKSEKLNMLGTAANNDMLTDRKIIELINELIAGNGIIQSNGNPQISDQQEERNQIEEKNNGENGKEAENYSFVDGDYI